MQFHRLGSAPTCLAVCSPKTALQLAMDRDYRARKPHKPNPDANPAWHGPKDLIQRRLWMRASVCWTNCCQCGTGGIPGPVLSGDAQSPSSTQVTGIAIFGTAIATSRCDKLRLKAPATTGAKAHDRGEPQEVCDVASESVAELRQ